MNKKSLEKNLLLNLYNTTSTKTMAVIPSWLMKFSSNFKNWTKKNNSKIKVAVSIYPGLAAVLLAFFKDYIIDKTTNAFLYIKAIGTPDYDEYTINWWVFVYWSLVFVWVYFYFKAILNESDTNKKNIADITSAIHNAPNPEIFLTYKIMIEQIFDDVQALKENIKDVRSKHTDQAKVKEILLQTYATTFRLILGKVCELAQSFSGKSDAIYGANIMRFIPADNEKHLAEINNLKEKGGWIHYEMVDTNNYIEGVVTVLPDLVYPGSQQRTVPQVTLPIFKNNGSDEEFLLPGACYAVKYGTSIINDTAHEYDTRDLSTKKEAAQFFTGVGASIKSICSINIPFPNRSIKKLRAENKILTIGVLNIDCDKRNVLSTEEKYYSTFFSLLKPITQLLATRLAQYFELLD